MLCAQEALLSVVDARPRLLEGGNGELMYAEEFKGGSSEMYRFSLRLGECRRRGGDGGAERRASESRSARRSGAEMETVGTWHDVSTGTVREKEKGEYGGGGRERTERDREREREGERERERAVH